MNKTPSVKSPDRSPTKYKRVQTRDHGVQVSIKEDKEDEKKEEQL